MFGFSQKVLIIGSIFGCIFLSSLFSKLRLFMTKYHLRQGKFYAPPHDSNNSIIFSGFGRFICGMNFNTSKPSPVHFEVLSFLLLVKENYPSCLSLITNIYITVSFKFFCNKYVYFMTKWGKFINTNNFSIYYIYAFILKVPPFVYILKTLWYCYFI